MTTSATTTAIIETPYNTRYGRVKVEFMATRMHDGGFTLHVTDMQADRYDGTRRSMGGRDLFTADANMTLCDSVRIVRELLEKRAPRGAETGYIHHVVNAIVELFPTDDETEYCDRPMYKVAFPY